MYNTCHDRNCYFRLQILSDIILAGAFKKKVKNKNSCGVENPNKSENPLTLLMEPRVVCSITPAIFHKRERNGSLGVIISFTAGKKANLYE